MASRKRLRDAWGPLPGRAAEATAAINSDPDPARRSPGRKDRKAWCRGKEGRAHVPMIVFCSPPVFRPGQVYECKWDSRWDGDNVRWGCYHQEHCQDCGKILRTSVTAAECSYYPGSDEQRAEAEAAATRAAARWAEWRRKRRPVISGPQGYRRKRA